MIPDKQKSTVEQLGDAVRGVVSTLRSWPQVFALLVIVSGAVIAYALYVGK